VAEELYTGCRGPAENFALLDKMCIFLRIIYSLSVFSLGNIRTAWSDAPSLVPFCSAFIVDEKYIFCL